MCTDTAVREGLGRGGSFSTVPGGIATPMDGSAFTIGAENFVLIPNKARDGVTLKVENPRPNATEIGAAPLRFGTLNVEPSVVTSSPETTLSSALLKLFVT